MASIPGYTIRCFGDGDALPAEAEEMFSEELAYSREPLPEDRPDRGKWQFACICAVTDSGHVLGGVHLDMGPMNFGPLANENLVFLEEVFVRPEYRNNGIATALMQGASAIAKGAGAHTRQRGLGQSCRDSFVQKMRIRPYRHQRFWSGRRVLHRQAAIGESGPQTCHAL